MTETHIYRIGLVLALLYSAIVLVTFPKWTVDDAYITYRYADNLARYGQLTFNIDEPTVEGYTGVVLPVILAGAIKLGLDPDTVSKAIGVVSYYFACLLLVVITRRLRLRPIFELALVVLYLTMPLYFTHVYAGLETMLFSCVLAAALLFLVRCLDSGTKRPSDEIVLWLVLLLGCLVRPEGMAMAGLSGAALVVHRWLQDRESVWRTVSRGLLLVGLPLAAYFAWKLSYYGHLLPNSYYAKLFGGTNSATIGRMEAYWHRYVSFVAAVGGLLCLMPVIDRIRRRPWFGNLFRAMMSHLWIIVILGVIAASGYEYTQSQLQMNYSHRFFVPFHLPILIVVAYLSHLGYNRTFSAGHPRCRVWIPVAAGLIIIIQTYRHVEHLPGEYRLTGEIFQVIQEALVPAGKTLCEAMPPNEWLVVAIDAGAMPYYSRLRTVDLGKLNDPVLARQKMSEREMVDYAFAHDPGAWVITSRSRDSLQASDLVNTIAHDPRLQNYTRAAMFVSTARPFYIEAVYVRNDLMPNWQAVYRAPE